MTEDEKKRIEAFIEAEKHRAVSSPLDGHKAEFNTKLKSTAFRRELMTGFSQQGITIDDLNSAYDEGYERGTREMFTFYLSFFYGAAAIAVHEAYPNVPTEKFAAFMHSFLDAPGDAPDREALLQKAYDMTGVDVLQYKDVLPRLPVKGSSHLTRKDRITLSRMMASGITQKDVELERTSGYENGWRGAFYNSSCYAVFAIAVSTTFACTTEQIENLISRVEEIQNEEVSVADILARCQAETGVDVSYLAEPIM